MRADATIIDATADPSGQTALAVTRPGDRQYARYLDQDGGAMMMTEPDAESRGRRQHTVMNTTPSNPEFENDVARDTAGRFTTKAVADAPGGTAALSAEQGQSPEELRAEYEARRKVWVEAKCWLDRGTTYRTSQAQVDEARAAMDEVGAQLRVVAEQKYTTRAAQDAYAYAYGDESYADYLEETALEYAERFPDRADYFRDRGVGEALRGNDGD